MDDLFIGPYVWSHQRPKRTPLYWPAILVMVAIPAFWIVVGVCLVRLI